MKKNFKRTEKLLCILLTMVLLLSACGGSNDSVSSDQSTTAGTSAAEKSNSKSAGGLQENTLPIAKNDVALEMYCGFANGARQIYQSMAEMDIVKQMMKETGLKLSFIHPPENDDGITYFTTMIASGKYPDIIGDTFEFYPGGPTAAMDDGVIIDATPLIEKHAYYYNKVLDAMDPVVRTRGLSDDGRNIRFGTTFLCSYLEGVAHGGFIVRKDLLNKAGITELPETIEDYEKMFDAFKAQGVTPLSLSLKDWQYRDYSPIASAFGVSYRTTHLENGKVVYSRTSPNYKKYLEVMNRWFKKGYFTTDSMSQPAGEAHKAFQAGKAGATICGSWEIINLESVGKASNADFKVVALPYPRQNKGDAITTFGTILENPEKRAMFVSAQCKNPEAAVRFIDYLYKPETMEMTAWGLNTDKQTLWKIDENGRHQWTDFITKNPDFDYEMGRQRYTANVLQGMWDEDMERLQYDIPQVQQAWTEWAKNTSRDNLTPQFMTPTTDESREISELLSQIETYGDEQVMAFISGHQSLDKFDGFVSNLKDLKVDRLCELYQSAFDRFLARKTTK